MEFKLENSCGNARAATLKTKHSTIKTPVFMPVATTASLKALSTEDLEQLETEIILANTYHTYLRPGEKAIKHFGGLHGFMDFKKSFLTDSGGFQAFSLSNNSKFQEDGINFKSHIDGSYHLFTPKKVLDIQYDLQSDIMMVLDDLVALPNTNERIEKSIQRTTKWAKESITYHKEQQQKGIGIDQNLFAIIQGGIDQKFRKISAESLCALKEFDGYAIGGLSVGEANQDMYDTVEYTIQFMPKDKPRYLMGVGTPEDLIENIHRGIDMFDCVMPTRNARNGTLFTSFGKINIKGAKYKLDKEPIDHECKCFVCKRYTRGYLNHLFKAKEIAYFRLGTYHNLHYYLNLMKEARASILENKWNEFKKDFYKKREK